MSMDWLDQNLDAYRVIAEILNDLRPLVRERLEGRFGREWFRDGIPEEIFDNLIRNKEQEASIDWYENRYQEVISYAVFGDLYEIINANPDLFGPILKLAPSPSLLNTRFLELEVMRSKIGRAREISEAEINFLTSFHLRFRRAVAELSGEPVEPAAAGPVDEAPIPSGDEGTTDVSVASDDAAPGGDADAAGAAATRPPQRLASAASAQPEAEDEADSPLDSPDGSEAVETDEEPQPESAAADQEGGAPQKKETTSAILNRAMANGDDQTVLRELYREVTGIAEVIWTTDKIPGHPAWDRVSSNSWYETNFSKLDLRPLSDFYELINQVRSNLQKGYTKAEIQSFLNDSRFATILLALRDMFQKNKI
jgi:hypothetical protein